MEELESIEGLLAAAGQRAVVFKYSGGGLWIWVEIEQDGEKRKVWDLRPLRPFLGDDSAANQESHLIWLRGTPDALGKESWAINLETKLFQTPKSGDAPKQSGAADGVRVEVVEGVLGNTGRQQVQLWKSGVTKGVRPLPSVSRIVIPSPVPTDRAVCLKEFREIREQDERAVLTTTAGTIGVLADPMRSPFIPCALLKSGRTDGICTIRLMCKVDSEKGTKAENTGSK